MKTFNWKGLDCNGNMLAGTVNAGNKALCETELYKRNIFPLKIKSNFNLSNFCARKITAKDINDFYKRLSILVAANITLVDSLEIIINEEKNADLKNLLINIKNGLQSGNSFNATLKKHPQYFNQLTTDLIYVGEQSGTLDVILNYIASYIEKTEKQKRKIINALMYPVGIFVTAIIVTAILLIYVIPEFKNVFANFGATLPLYTQIIFQLAEFLKTYGVFIVFFIGIFIFGFFTLKKRSLSFRQKLDIWVLQIPIAGVLINMGIVYRIFKTFTITYKAGLTIIESLKICATVANNWQFHQAIEIVVQDITLGLSLNNAIKNQKIFSHTVTQLIAIGEETGRLDNMLEKLTNIYEEQINNFTDNLNNLLEPMIMVILGVLVGGLMIGMYLPIFSLGKLV